MGFAQRTDNGPGTGSVLLDLSGDNVWDPESERCPRRLYIEGAGNVKFTGLDGNDDTWTVAAKSYIEVSVQKVFASGGGTTATGIHAIW